MADKRRQKPDLTEEQLDQLAQVTPEDVQDAQRAWRQDAAPGFKDLLDAEPDEPEQP